MKCGCKMKELKGNKEFNHIDKRLNENIKLMFKELSMNIPTDEKIKNVKDTFIEMFVDVDRLKGLIIENTSNELMKVFNQSPHLLKIIKDKKENGEEFYL